MEDIENGREALEVRSPGYIWNPVVCDGPADPITQMAVNYASASASASLGRGGKGVAVGGGMGGGEMEIQPRFEQTESKTNVIRIY